MGLSRLSLLLLVVLSALLLSASAQKALAQDDLPCPAYPISYSDVPNLQAPWVATCGHCFSNPTPTGTAFPTLAPTLTPSPTRTNTPVNTPTITPTSGPTMTGTPNTAAMLSGSTINRFELDSSLARVHLGNFPIAPDYSISPVFDPSFRTDTTGAVWEVVGFYYYIDPATTTGPTNFYLQPNEEGLFISSEVNELQDFYAQYLAASGHFACFDAEIYTGSFDFACDAIFEYMEFTDPDLFTDWSDVFFGNESVRVLFHSHARHIFNPMESFTIPIAWQGGEVEWDNNFPTPPPLLTSEISLFAIMRYPYANYSPPPPTPDPPVCEDVVFTAPNCAQHAIYFIDNHTNETVFSSVLTEDSCYGSAPVGTLGGSFITSALSYDGGVNGKFESIGFQIDLGGVYSVTDIQFEATNWGYAPSYYRATIWVWDVNAGYWDKVVGDTPADAYNAEMWVNWVGETSHIYIATSAFTASGLPRATHQINYSDIVVSIVDEGLVSLSPTTSLCQPVTPTPTPAPTATGGTPAPTSTPQTVATFTRTPSRTPTPSATQSVNSYCLNPQWRNTPTPTLVSTSTPTLNATQTSLAVTRTPNALPTVQQQFTQTAAVATGTVVVQTATQHQNQTATQQQQQTATGAAPITATYIASTPGNDVKATSDALSNNFNDAPVVGGGSGHTINVGGAPDMVANSTLDLNDDRGDMLYRFSWDPQPRRGACMVVIPKYLLDRDITIPLVGSQKLYLEIPNVNFCMNWVDIPAMEALGYPFPLELLILPIFLIMYRRIWNLGT